MAASRSFLDFPRNEPGLVDKFIGTAYDTVKQVSDNLPAVQRVDGVIQNPQPFVDMVLDEFGNQIFPQQDDTPPAGAKPGMEWISTVTGRRYVWFVDVNGGKWVEMYSATALTVDVINEQVLAELSTPSGAGKIGAGVRTQAEKNRDVLSVRDGITTPVDGVTSNQVEIQAKINEAIEKQSDLFWPFGTYVSTESFENFWAVRHYGPGVIKRGDTIFFITPVAESHTNTLYSSLAQFGVSNTNDGLHRDSPTTVAVAKTRLMSIGDKCMGGSWVLDIAGAGIQSGFTLDNLPAFKNTLTIRGQEYLSGSLPVTRWTRNPNGSIYAIRNNKNVMGLKILVENIWFEDWNSSEGNAGAFASDTPMMLRTRKCRVTNSNIGFWNQFGITNTVGCYFEDITSFAHSVSYNGYGNVGVDGVDSGNTYVRCFKGPSISRGAIAYIENSDWYEIGTCAIEGNKNARFRERNNRYHSWGTVAAGVPQSILFLEEGAIANNDNNSGRASQILLPLSDERPFLRASSGAIPFFLGPAGVKNVVASAALDSNVVINTDELVNLDTPFAKRLLALPAYTLYGAWQIDINILMLVAANTACTFRLSGAGAANSVSFGSVNIPAQSEAKFFELSVSYQKIPGKSGVIVTYSAPQIGLYSTNYQVTPQANLDSDLVRRASEELIAYRTYMQRTSGTGSVVVNRISTYLTLG